MTLFIGRLRIPTKPARQTLTHPVRSCAGHRHLEMRVKSKMCMVVTTSAMPPRANPFCVRMRGDIQPYKLATTVPQDQQPIQQSKRDCRDQEQIHRGDAVGMVAEEGLLALRRRSPSPCHVLCDRGLPNVDAMLEQFAVHAWCAHSGLAMLMSRMSRPTATT